jgi:predicted DNA-binding transcriptional regulator YafY/transcriptional regulator with XRE-family HTH domain
MAASGGSAADAHVDAAGQDRDSAAKRRELVTQLARRRAAAGLSQADVAELMQTSQSAVARLESGRHDAQLSTLARYAEALGMSRLSLDLTGDAGTPARGSGDGIRGEAGRTPLAGQGSLEQPQYGEPLQAEARLKGRPGRKPKNNMPAAVPQTPDRPDPDHVLTGRQREVLQVIRQSIEKRGHPPSLREIGDAVGLTSTSSVSHQLRTLQRAGYLHRDSGRPRTVELRDHAAVLRVWSGTGFGLRRHAVWVRADDRPDGQGWDLVATRFADMAALAEYAASFGPDVVVLDPPDLREAVIAKLKGAELEVRPAMSRPADRPGAPVGGTAPAGARAAANVSLPDGVRVEKVAAQIGAALAARRRVRLQHYNDRTDVVTKREVDPMRLFVEPGRPAPYLVGWCRLRESTRFFRLDRVLSLDVLDVPASPPAEAWHVNVEHGLFQPSEADMRVELELSAAGRWVAESYTCESVSDLADGGLRVVLRTPDTGWVRRLALRLGEDGRVVSPPALVTGIRWAAAAALANYHGGSAVGEPDPGGLGPCGQATAHSSQLPGSAWAASGAPPDPVQ